MKQLHFEELTLYELYGTSSKEELYRKIKQKEKEVAELSSFIEYMKQDREREGIFIQKKEDFFEYLKTNPLLEEKKIKILSMDTSNKILEEHIFPIEELSNMKKIFQEMYHPNMKSCMIAYYDFNSFPSLPRKLQQFEDNLEKIGIHTLDTMAIMGSQKRIYSYRAEDFSTFQPKRIRKKNHNFLEKSKNTTNADKSFQEFTEFYVEKEIVGRNLITEEKEIRGLLKVAKGNLNQEHFAILEYDHRYQITNIKTLFTGGLDRSTVDPITMIPYFLDSSKGICLLHNHPSKNAKPSSADLHLTNKIVDIAKQFEKQIYDHFIVGSKVFSFREESLIKDHRAEGIASLNQKDTLKVIEQCGMDFMFVNEIFKKDKEVALRAIEKNANTFYYVSSELKDDKEVVLKAVEKDGDNIEFASDRLRDDKEVACAAIQQNPKSVRYLFKDLRDLYQKEGREGFLKAMKKEKNILEVSSKEEKEVQELRNPWAKKLVKINDLSR